MGTNTGEGYRLGLVLLLFSLNTFGYAQNSIQYTLEEEKAVGTLVGNVKRDSGLSSRFDNATFQSLSYNLRFSRDQQYFSINDRTGILTTASIIDREEVCQSDPCLMEVDINVRPMQYFQILKLTIHILDINDHQPSFDEERVIRAISETILLGVSFQLPSAEDADSGPNGIEYYELTPIANTSPSKFSLETSDNADGTKDINLVLRAPLNREEEEEYSFRITAYDGGSPRKSGSMMVDITITDANDNNPVFDSPTYDVEISENTAVGTTITQVHASDEDVSDNGRVMYGFSVHTQADYGHLFHIVDTSGEIVVIGQLDYEQQAVYHLTITGTDLGPNALPAYSKVIVRVLDENDQPPAISINTLSTSGFAEVAEHSSINTFISHVSVTDADEGMAGEVNCSLGGQDSALFALQQLGTSEYKVTTQREFDREEQSEYQLSLTCSDRGTPCLTSSQDLRVHILDINDQKPRFTQTTYYANFDENNNENINVVTVRASDSDEGQNAVISYSIRGVQAAHNNLLKIDSVTGVVKTRVSVDFEDGRSYSFIITAQDAGSTNRQSATATLSLNINDLNDELPVFEQNQYAFSVSENQPVGSVVGFVKAVDDDAFPFGDVSYYIDRTQSENSVFDIITETNGRGKIVTSQRLDREMASKYNLFVVAHNEGYFNTANTVVVTIDVADENDNDPVIFFPRVAEKSVEISNKIPVGDTVVRINASDSDTGPNAQLLYTITSGNEDEYLELDNRTGIISAAQSLLNLKHHVFNLEIVVKDNGIPQRLAAADLTVIVDRGVAYGNSDDGLVSKAVLMVILGVIFGVLFLFIMIVIIICCVCYHMKKVDNAHKYNCRLEANKTLMGSPASKRLASPDQNSSRQNSFNMERNAKENGESTPEYRSPNDIDLVPHDSLYGKTPIYLNGNVMHPQHNGGTSREGHSTNDMDCTKMPDVVNLSHTEVDSECSGADSGKGTSEEGDGPWVQNQSQNSSQNSDLITSPSSTNSDCNKQPHSNIQVTVDQNRSPASPLYNIDANLDLYQGHDPIYQPAYNRNYATLYSFCSKSPNPVSSPAVNYSKQQSYPPVRNVDKYCTAPRICYGNNVDINKIPPSGVSRNSPLSSTYPVESSYQLPYTPGKGDSTLGVAFGQNKSPAQSPNPYAPPFERASPQRLEDATNTQARSNNNSGRYTIDNAIPMETWMGREGSTRGQSVDRTHLFGSSNALNGTANNGQKSAFKAVGKNGTLKKNVRFADKNEELDITVDEDISSVDNLSDDGTSITSGTYVLDEGTVVLEGRTANGDTFV